MIVAEVIKHTFVIITVIKINYTSAPFFDTNQTFVTHFIVN